MSGLGAGSIGAAVLGVPGFRPRDISGCILWLRADLGITLNGGDVSAWADQSGNGNDATQATASWQPAYSANGWSAGVPTVDFSEAAGPHRLATGVFAETSNDYTFLTAFDYANSAAAGVLLESVAPNRITAYAREKSATKVGIYDTLGNRASSALVQLGKQSLEWLLDSSGPSMTIYRGGVVAGTGGYTGLSKLDTAVTIGAGSAPEALTAGVAEVAVYNRVITSAERATLQAYFDNRYGL